MNTNSSNERLWRVLAAAVLTLAPLFCFLAAVKFFPDLAWLCRAWRQKLGLFVFVPGIACLVYVVWDIWRRCADRIPSGESASERRPSRVLSICAAVSGMGFPLATNVLSNQVSDYLKEAEVPGVEIYANGDLARLSGQCVRLAVLRHASSMDSGRERESVENLADLIPEYWIEASSDTRIQAVLGHGRLVDYVVAPESDALTAGIWLEMLMQWRERAGIDDISVASMQAASNVISRDFGITLRESLKADYASGGKAWAAMQLDIAQRLLNRTQISGYERNERMTEALREVQGILADDAKGLPALHQIVLDVAQSQGRYAREVADSFARLSRILEQMKLEVASIARTQQALVDSYLVLRGLGKSTHPTELTTGIESISYDSDAVDNMLAFIIAAQIDPAPYLAECSSHDWDRRLVALSEYGHGKFVASQVDSVDCELHRMLESNAAGASDFALFAFNHYCFDECIIGLWELDPRTVQDYRSVRIYWKYWIQQRLGAILLRDGAPPGWVSARIVKKLLAPSYAAEVKQFDPRQFDEFWFTHGIGLISSALHGGAHASWSDGEIWQCILDIAHYASSDEKMLDARAVQFMHQLRSVAMPSALPKSGSNYVGHDSNYMHPTLGMYLDAGFEFPPNDMPHSARMKDFSIESYDPDSSALLDHARALEHAELILRAIEPSRVLPHEACSRQFISGVANDLAGMGRKLESAAQYWADEGCFSSAFQWTAFYFASKAYLAARKFDDAWRVALRLANHAPEWLTLDVEVELLLDIHECQYDTASLYGAEASRASLRSIVSMLRSYNRQSLFPKAFTRLSGRFDLCQIDASEFSDSVSEFTVERKDQDENTQIAECLRRCHSLLAEGDVWGLAAEMSLMSRMASRYQIDSYQLRESLDQVVSGFSQLILSLPPEAAVQVYCRSLSPVLNGWRPQVDGLLGRWEALARDKALSRNGHRNLMRIRLFSHKHGYAFIPYDYLGSLGVRDSDSCFEAYERQRDAFLVRVKDPMAHAIGAIEIQDAWLDFCDGPPDELKFEVQLSLVEGLVLDENLMVARQKLEGLKHQLAMGGWAGDHSRRVPSEFLRLLGLVELRSSDELGAARDWLAYGTVADENPLFYLLVAADILYRSGHDTDAASALKMAEAMGGESAECAAWMLRSRHEGEVDKRAAAKKAARRASESLGLEWLVN